jgi:regulator of cell morphogenesis and NO signaling
METIRPTAPARFDGGTTINQIVAAYPHTHPVFEGFGLDTCCGGGKPLRKACEAHGLDYAAVLAALEQAASAA